ncbi:hypothetical protein ACOJQI_13005 [Bacillus salacetis]|uniref:hypothetical protein n=1 Tax=Bacillus salacetis TaxID=2315464 RepID=UPI003B9F8975
MRKGPLNRNSIYFFILALVHLFLLIATLLRKKERITWVLLLTNMGMAYIFEYVVLNYLQAYKYKPSVVKTRYLDNIFGAILSQGIYVPIAATFITVFNGNWKWRAGFSCYFFLIEKLFLKLGLYKLNWWKPYFTPCLLMIYFFISDRMYHAMKGKKQWALATAQYLALEVIGVSLLYCTAASRKLRFGLSRYHSWKEHFLIAPLYSLSLSFLGVLLSFKHHFFYRIVFLGGCMLVDYILIKIGILKMKTRQILSNIPFHVFMIFLSRQFYKSIYKWGAHE